MDHEKLLGMAPLITHQVYGFRDTILYALGVGAGIEPATLDLVYEKGIETLATMAVVLATPGLWVRNPDLRIDWKKMLQAEQMLTLHKPLPPEGRVASELRIDALYDKGERTGALLYSSRRLYDESTGDALATLRQSMMLRSHGGFREQKDASSQPARVPARPADVVTDLPTRPEQALIYRLSGDYNPLHCDPDVAREAGFPKPILHGLCTYGIAGRALTHAIKSKGASRITRMDARFISPVYPGETIRTQIWWLGEQAAFRCVIVERAVVAIDNGLIEYS